MANDDSSVMIVEDALDNEFWIKDGVLIKHLSLSSTVPIPDSVKSIGDGAFRWCVELRNITLPNGISSIGTGMFSRCQKLERITLPDSLQSIGRYAFDGCTSLRSLTVPAGVTFIDDPAFADCARSESLHIHNVDPSSVDPASVKPPQYTVCVYAGSYAEKYVKERNIPFEII